MYKILIKKNKIHKNILTNLYGSENIAENITKITDGIAGRSIDIAYD